MYLTTLDRNRIEEITLTCHHDMSVYQSFEM